LERGEEELEDLELDEEVGDNDYLSVDDHCVPEDFSWSVFLD